MTTTQSSIVPSSTEWVPLTTLGPSLSPECSSAVYVLPGAGSTSDIIAFDPIYGKYIDTKVKCLAAEQTTWWEQEISGVPVSIELGPFTCPNGYSTVTTSPINPETKFIGCCPSGYEYAGTIFPPGLPGQCKSGLTSGQTVTAKTTATSPLAWVDTTSVISASRVSMVGVHVNGFAFTDRTVTPHPQTPTSQSTASVSSSSGSSGLSAGAKIGIGVGVGLGAFGAVCLIAAALILKRRSRKHSSQIPLQISSPTEGMGTREPRKQRKVNREHPVDRWEQRMRSRDNRTDSGDDLW